MKAKAVPSVADIAEVKAQKILSQVMEVMKNQDLSDATAIIEEKMEADDCTAIDLAAAFLKLGMGDSDKEDIPTESYESERKGRRRGKDGRGRRDDRRDGERDGRRFKSHDRKFKGKDSKDERFGQKDKDGSRFKGRSDKNYGRDMKDKNRKNSEAAKIKDKSDKSKEKKIRSGKFSAIVKKEK